MITYPRLSPPAAVEQLALLSSCGGHDEMVELADVQHSQAHWYATGARCTEHDLRRLAEAVRECAARHGYPDPLGGRSTSATAFDREVSGLLLATMNIVPADAADDGVWSFISLVLLPDVAFWRFPNTQQRADYERLLGRPRNVFRRLWWRAWTLGPVASASIFEDEAVAILERPTIGGDRRLASGIIDRHLAMARDNPNLPRTELLRQVAKRVRRLAAVVTLAALEDVELDQLVTEVAEASLQALVRPTTTTGTGP